MEVEERIERIRNGAVIKWLEVMIWFCLCLYLGEGFWGDLYDFIEHIATERSDSYRYFTNIFDNNLEEMFFAILSAIFPILYLNINGVLPIAEIIAKFASIGEAKKYDFNSDSLNSEQYLQLLSAKSENIALGMEKKARIYMIVGVTFSAAGILALILSSSLGETKLDITASLLDTLPKLGAFAFVQAIAFFFLKQYRVSMEEFRYYEAIKRKQEENILFYKTAAEHEWQDILKLSIANGSMFSSGFTLDSGKTTQVLETDKLETSDYKMLEKIIGGIFDKNAANK
ncbi:hypothetical protein [Marinobacterium mangrovicola]|uniref:Uncharacterized protein n=1 Tax=Marinobacterium mangrovicola TaxID=1476959 RepID=A0A4V6ND22_9GAMM|nr:hypothetical protein [Marinobacterium mangrovicola]TCK08986.1 hypothetical protein CLV83_1082 [Marinobacterium mangrovicola]